MILDMIIAMARRIRQLVLAAVVALAVAACSGSGSVVAGSPSPRKTLNVVAGENFWGSIVGQLAGRAGRVTSIVTDPNADPHDYQSSSDDARAVATADYVVLTGAGYDSWADKLLSGNPSARRKVLTVADLLGTKEGDNPHVWYDPDLVARVTDRVEADLKSLDAPDTAYFNARRASFDAAMAPVRSRLASIKARFAGTPVASTESIFEPLGRYLGLNLISPPEFMQAVAEGNDPPAPTVAEFQDQITTKQARVLVYNRQTSTAITTNIKTLAVQAGIPTVAVTETIQPPDATFESWFDSELQQLQNALGANARSAP
jgi:zinc/manganese transport system substrate-binding protein